MLHRIIALLTPVDIDEFIAYQYKVPESISVSIKKSDDGYIARVDKINDKPIKGTTFIVEAKTPNELVNEVNDTLFDYLDFPERIKVRMPILLPPEYAVSKLSQKNSHPKELVFAK